MERYIYILGIKFNTLQNELETNRQSSFMSNKIFGLFLHFNNHITMILFSSSICLAHYSCVVLLIVIVLAKILPKKKKSQKKK
jgi:hypothetical protein